MFSLRCLFDVHEWTTEAVVIRGQSWADDRERCRRCGTPKPDLSRRTFIFGAVAMATVAAMGPLEILAPVAPRLGLLGSGIIPSHGAELSAVVRRAFIPKLIVQMHQTTPTLTRMLEAAGRASVARVVLPVSA